MFQSPEARAHCITEVRPGFILVMVGRSCSPLILSLLRSFPGLLVLRQIVGDLHGVVHERLLNVFIQL